MPPAFKAAQDILQGTGNEEIFLLEAELFAIKYVVVGVEDLGEVFGQNLVGDGIDIFAAIEIVEVKIGGCFGRPQTESIDSASAVADNRQIVGHADDVAGIDPAPFLALRSGDDVHAAFELNGKRVLGAGDFPGVAELEPLVGLFDLVAVDNLLIEDAEIVAESVADGGETQSGHRVEKAGRQTA